MAKYSTGPDLHGREQALKRECQRFQRRGPFFFATAIDQINFEPERLAPGGPS